jgi:hypothetical protein
MNIKDIETVKEITQSYYATLNELKSLRGFSGVFTEIFIEDSSRKISVRSSTLFTMLQNENKENIKKLKSLGVEV